MDFESLKEQFYDRFFEVKGRVEDSESYIRLKERYDNLSAQAQTGIKALAIFLGLFFLYSLPAAYLSSAQEKMDIFEENRQLTRDLIRAGRLEKTLQLPSSAPPADVLTTRIQQALDGERVLNEQKVGIIPRQDVADKKLVPANVIQTGLRTSVKKINLKQIVRIGESLHNIQGSKLINLAIQADSKDPHYFNVDFEVAGFSAPEQNKPAAPTKKNSFSRSRSRVQ